MHLPTGSNHPRTVYVLPNGGRAGGRTNAATEARLLHRHHGGPTPLGDGPRRGHTQRQPHQLLRDADGDAVRRDPNVFIEGLHSPVSAWCWVVEDFYVRRPPTRSMKFPYHEGDTRIHRAVGREAGRAPSGTINPTGQGSSPPAPWIKAYATVGSNNNVGENRKSSPRTNRAAGGSSSIVASASGRVFAPSFAILTGFVAPQSRRAVVHRQ